MAAAPPFIVPVFLPGAGCPHRCAFCNQHEVTGVSAPLCSTTSFQRIVRRFLSYKGPRSHHRCVQISFYGGNFLGLGTRTRARLLSAAQRYVQRGDVDAIRFSTRPDTIDSAALTAIEDYAVSTIELGAQSMDDRVLHRCQRGHTAAHTERAVALLKRRGYEVGVQMMVGLPGDTDAGAVETARRIAALAPAFVRIYPTLVFRNSLLARWYGSGDYLPLALDACVTLVKRLFLMFSDHGIPVVRMGLLPSEDPRFAASLLAGPFHPAFGHLVHAEIFLDRARWLLRDVKDLTGKVTFRVHPRSQSRLRGEKNGNLQVLKGEFGLTAVRIVTDAALGMAELAVDGAEDSPDPPGER